MKTMKQISARRWYLYLLMLLVIVSASDDLIAQNAPVEPDAKPSKVVESSQTEKNTSPLDKLKKPIDRQVQAAP